MGVIVFASDRDGDGEIFAVNVDRRGLPRLTDNSVRDTAPVVSPDGTIVAFAREGAGGVVRGREGTGVTLRVAS